MGDSNIKVPFEPTEKFYEFLKTEIKLSSKRAFEVIYYLQEHFEWDGEDGTHHDGILPDTYEQCQKCKDLFDSTSDGCFAMLCEHCYTALCPDVGCEDCKHHKKVFG